VKIYLSFVGILLTFIVIGYLESPYSVFNKEYATVSSIPYEVALAEQSETVSPEEIDEQSSKNEEIAALNFSLEMVLESKSEIDDYIVETYQEYEIYKDKTGQVIKKIPTSHFDYLRYRK
jgi:hypothetical protein